MMVPAFGGPTATLQISLAVCFFLFLLSCAWQEAAAGADLRALSNAPEETQCDDTDDEDCLCLKIPSGASGWSCEAGKYCPEPGESFECPKGYYCPENSLEPTLCCSGFYCSTPSQIKKCDSGHFCKPGQIEPFACGWLDSCQEGTREPGATGVFAVLGVAVVALVVASIYKDRYFKEKEKERGYRQQRMIEFWHRLTGSRRMNAPNTERRNPSHGQGIELPSRRDIEMQTRPQLGYLIEFENLGVRLPDGRKILSGVSGSLKPGRLTAIMGASGAGKTTFINVLSNKLERTEGTIKVDGKRKHDGLAEYRTVFGFVPQEDVMLRQFSAYYNVTFSAKYRLPKTVSKTKRQIKVTKVIRTLGLLGVQNEDVGDERQRGISGGQRKRVNIGIELVNDCSILFLDEPTSGLDASTAMEISHTLRNTAEDTGMTIAAILHQPRAEIFDTFTDLLLLGDGGRTIYSGPRDQIMSYLEQLGFRSPPNNNPADYVSDVSSGRVYRDDSEFFKPENGTFFPAELLPKLWQLYQQGKLNHESIKAVELEHLTGSSNAAIPEWNDEAKKSCFEKLSLKFVMVCWNIFRELRAQANNFKDTFFLKKLRPTPGIAFQFVFCCSRAFKAATYSIGRLFAENILHFFVGFFLGITATENADHFVGPFSENMQKQLCPFVLQNSCKSPLVNGFQELGMFICWGVSFAGAAVASNTFGPEETNYWREASAGLYTAPYFAAKAAVDLLKVGLAALVFEVAYFAAATSAVDIYDFYTVILLLYFNGFNIGYFITTLAGVRLSPLVSLVVTLLCSAILSGFTVGLNEVEHPWHWLFRTSYARWGLEYFYIISVENFDYFNLQPGFDMFGYTRDNRKVALLYMLATGFGWSLLSCIVMILRHVDKKR